GERRQLIKTTDPESNPHFTFDQKSIYFTRQNNLYVLSLADASLEQLTDIRSSSPASTPASRQSTAVRITARVSDKEDTNATQEYLKKEERSLLDATREKSVQREEQEAKRKQRETRKPFNLPNGQNVVNLALSPNKKYVIATITDPVSGTKTTIVPNFV